MQLSSSNFAADIESDEKVIRRLEKKLAWKNPEKAAASCFSEFGLSDIWDIIGATESVHKKKEDELPDVVEKKSKKKKIKIDKLEELEEPEKPCKKVKTDKSVRPSDQKDSQDNHQRVKIIIEPEEIDEKLIKRIRGLLNRLSSCNLMKISSDIEELFKEYSLHQATLCLTKSINDQLVQEAYLSPQRLVSEYTMLVAVLNTNIGDEIGGHIIHQFIKQFDVLMNLTSDKREDSKKLDNLVAFICYCYACGLINSTLIFDILDRLTDKFDDKSIEVSLLAFRMVGFIMRRDDPLKLKKIIVNVQSKASSYETKNSRIVFMLEALAAIKNNNVNKLSHLNDDSPISPIDPVPLRKTIKSGLRAKTSVSCLPGGYAEIIQSNRWWMKSELLLLKEATINETSSSTEQRATLSDKAVKSKRSEPDIYDSLCSKLRLATPLRKSVLKSLLTCEDYIDCTRRLIDVGGKQFSEVINVCLIVALKEKLFNPFYIHLFKQLSICDRKYKLSLIHAFRDRLNSIERLSKTEQNNLSRLIVELLRQDVIPITVLKTFQFSDLSEDAVELMRSILVPVFASDDEVTIRVLSKLKPKEHFTAALKLFISCFMDPKYKEKMLFLRK